MSSATSWVSRSGPLRVMDMSGQLVSYDNRRLMAARVAGINCVRIQRVAYVGKQEDLVREISRTNE